MADKEQRIALFSWIPNSDDICPAPTELQCGGAKSCKECKVGISRQEAVERMARALCSCQTGGCNKCYVKDNKEACLLVLDDGLYTKHAEAALDVLLKE